MQYPLGFMSDEDHYQPFGVTVGVTVWGHCWGHCLGSLRRWWLPAPSGSPLSHLGPIRPAPPRGPPEQEGLNRGGGRDLGGAGGERRAEGPAAPVGPAGDDEAPDRVAAAVRHRAQ